MRAVQAKAYDATAELGLPVVLTGRLRLLKCGSCGSLAAPGHLLENAAQSAVLALLEKESLLSGREAQFLRKAALSVGQVELAERLGVSRPTVARWEAEAALSSEHDFELKGLVLGELLAQSREKRSEWRHYGKKLLALAAQVMRSARRRPPARPTRPLRLAA
jgi:DNA-binding transcriptional regulator YiaG